MPESFETVTLWECPACDRIACREWSAALGCAGATGVEHSRTDMKEAQFVRVDQVAPVAGEALELLVAILKAHAQPVAPAERELRISRAIRAIDTFIVEKDDEISELRKLANSLKANLSKPEGGQGDD